MSKQRTHTEKKFDRFRRIVQTFVRISAADSHHLHKPYIAFHHMIADSYFDQFGCLYQEIDTHNTQPCEMCQNKSQRHNNNPGKDRIEQKSNQCLTS